jgi:cell division protease FtsH
MIAPRSVYDLLTPEVEFEYPGDPDAVRPVRLMKKEHADPAMLAARHMLRLALSDPALRAAAAANGTAVIVLVPDAAWLDLVIEQWTDVVRGGVEPRDGDVEMRRTPTWISFKRSGLDKIGQPEKSNEAIDFALWNGTAVTAFGTADRHLPGSVVAAADHRIVIAPPARSTVRFLIRCMFGRSCIGPVTKDLARSLTPSILRQARRPGQSATDYLDRLVAIVARVRDTGRPGPMLEQLHGMREAAAWGIRLVRDLEDYRSGRIRWSDMDRGLLLHGAPGTGKGLFVEALSRSCGIPLVATSFATWQAAKTGHLGDCLSAMRADFDKARRLAPCILYIDELDAIGSREGGDREYRDYWTAVITGLLEQLDGVGDREGVVTVGATNHPGALDPALVRSGRFDRSVAIPLPDQTGLVGIIRYHLGTDLAGEDLSAAARLAIGATGADCARFVRNAKQMARHAGRPVRLEDLSTAIAGPRKCCPPETLLRIAIHEAGHAVAAAVVRPGKLVGATIIERGNTGGSVHTVAHRIPSDRNAVRVEIAELLAGRAAEEAILGDASGGSGGSESSDLALATILAVAEETALGLGGSGLLWTGWPEPRDIRGILSADAALAVRVRERLGGIYAGALVFAREHHRAIRVVAAELVLNKAMSGIDIEALVARHPPAAEVVS